MVKLTKWWVDTLVNWQNAELTVESQDNGELKNDKLTE